MYSSLQKIDIVVDETPPLYVQTDHRTRDEIEAEPEISVLFALARILNARAYGVSKQLDPTVVYVALDDDPPDLLREAIGAAKGVLERGSDRTRIQLPATTTPAELADRAFGNLARRVARRVGLTDMSAVLTALEAETVLDPPDVEEDEIGYWTRVCELCAVTCEVLRTKRGGKWVDCDRAEIPFGFSSGGDGIMLPSNRAQRFISDGEGESMFQLIATDEEMRTYNSETSPVLPSLRARSEAIAQQMVWKPLLGEGDRFEHLPVIAYGRDTPSAFSIATTINATHDVEQLHAEALVNITKQDVTIDPLDIDDIKLLAVSGSFYATEKLLDQKFMKGLQTRVGQPLLAVTVPRRGLMFVTGAITEPRGMAILRAATHHESGTSRSISEAILLVQDGSVVGEARLDNPDPLPDPPKKKPGFFRRLLGRA